MLLVLVFPHAALTNLPTTVEVFQPVLMSLLLALTHLQDLQTLIKGETRNHQKSWAPGESWILNDAYFAQEIKGNEYLSLVQLQHI